MGRAGMQAMERAPMSQERSSSSPRSLSVAEQAIEEHNRGCLAACLARRPVQGGDGCGYQRTDGSKLYSKRCPDCPRDWMIEYTVERVDTPVSESALRTEEPEAPRRACTLMLRIGADDRASLVRAVEEFARTIDERREPGGACGGYDYGWSYELSAKDRPTHDEYVAALDAYLEASDVRR